MPGLKALVTLRGRGMTSRSLWPLFFSQLPQSGGICKGLLLANLHSRTMTLIPCTAPTTDQRFSRFRLSKLDLPYAIPHQYQGWRWMKRQVLGLLGLLGLLLGQPAAAQTFVAGEDGWQLERLADDFVLLRTRVQQFDAGGQPSRQGLLILTCERQARRIRFQLGDTARLANTQFSELGRAFVRGERDGTSFILKSVRPNVRFFQDGSFEFLEAVGFSDAIMRDFLGLLQRLPTQLEIVLFKGPETRAFLRGTALRVHLVRLKESLGDVYGFEGLCFRAPT